MLRVSRRQSLGGGNAGGIDGENESKSNQTMSATNNSFAAAQGSAKKSFKSMFPMWVSGGGSKDTSASVPPPLPKKIKIANHEQEQEVEEEVFDTDATEAIKRTEALPLQQKTGRATLAPSEGLAARGVKREEKEEESEKPPRALIRHASSNGSQQSTSSVGDGVFNRLAKTDIRFTEMKNKLQECSAQLTAANKRVEEIERENERLLKENRELRRKVDALVNPDRRSRKPLQQIGEEPSSSGLEDDLHVVKIENLEKATTSKTLLQLAENSGAEVTTVRIVRVPTSGAIHGYCSFATGSDAIKAVEHLKRSGLSAAIMPPSATGNDDKRMAKRWRN